MKRRIFSILFALVLVASLGLVTGASAQANGLNSTYKFVYEVPDPIVVNTDVAINVTFETDEPGADGYDNVRFAFNTTGPGYVTFNATDSVGDKHTFINSGYWGPSTGFDLSANYTATTEWTLNFSQSGNYTITFSLITASDGEVVADITDSVTVTVVAPITEAEVSIHPKTLNLRSQGRWITAYIELNGNDIADIDIGTVQLLYEGKSLNAEWGDVQNENGRRLMVKFDRATVSGWFDELHDEEVELTVAGEVNGTQFEGTDTIRVIDPVPPGRGKPDGVGPGNAGPPAHAGPPTHAGPPEHASAGNSGRGR